jgi:hypothetical protein
VPVSFAGGTPDIIFQRMKTIVVLLAASGLLLASQRPAQAQVSWGIPLPFPFLFYNFDQGYQQPQPYYGNQSAYYNQPYNGGQPVYYRPGYSRPGDCTPSRHAYFYRPYYQPRSFYRPQPSYYYGPQPGYYGPRWGGYGGW